MVISQPPGIILHIIIRASPTLPQLLWMLPETPYMFYTCNYNIRVTHRNGAIKHICFTRIRSTEGSWQIVLYSFVAPCACSSSSGSNITSNLSVWRFESTFNLTYICRLYFPPECQQDRTLLHQPILLSENIPNIWRINHQQNTRRSRQIETIKTIMQTTRPRITWKVLPMAQVAIFKEIFDQKCEKI